MLFNVHPSQNWLDIAYGATPYRTMPADQSLRERDLVTRNSGKRPYGAKLCFQISHVASVGGLEHVSIFMESGAVVEIAPAKQASWEGGKKLKVSLAGFSTATEAEAEGMRLAQSLLLTATSLDFGLGLVYHGRLPAAVYERYRSDGASMFAEGASGRSAEMVLAELVSAFKCPMLDPALTLSMELYCSSLLESNERARFVGAVSALEPLAKQERLGDSVDSFVDSALTLLRDRLDIKEELRASLRGRIEQLRRESVRQALLRLADSWFPGRGDLRRQIDHVYGLRSELLHNGTLSDPDCDLHVEHARTKALLRAIYSQVSGRQFVVSAGI